MQTRSSQPARLLRRVLLCLALGAITTVAIAWGSAAIIPLDQHGGTVALDGDHLQPWLIRLEHPTGERIVWFEKGRIYNKQPAIGPPGGSSAAVANWSFATATRSNRSFTRGEVPLPKELRELIERRGHIWGAAVDRRGWPFPAMQCRFTGYMSPPAASAEIKLPSIYTLESGSAIERDAAAAQPRESLATLRAYPLAPAWPGLAADVAILGAAWFGVLLWLAGSGLAAARGARRERRGRCPACGYDLRHDLAGGCPECGWRRATASEGLTV
jgi:hypothetical protein